MTITRILRTPVGDLARGRITGPTPYRDAILSAGLPRPLADLTLEVTRRTRLRRREKSDVARELVAHFRDGLEAGATSDALSAAFGNPVYAARLIRRAKKRNRSLLWHAWVNAWKAIGALFVVCAAVYAILAVRFYAAHPTLKRNLAAEMNAPILEMPESDKAWPVYRRAYLSLPPRPAAILNSKIWPYIEPTDEQWPDFVAYVESAQATIALVHQAAALPHMGFIMSDGFSDREMLAHGAFIHGGEPSEWAEPPPPSDNPPLIGVVLPHLGYLRDFARHLAADGRIALSRADSARFQSDVNAILSMVSHTAEHPFLISQLVSRALAAVATDLMGKALDEHPSLLTDAQLVALAHRFAIMPAEIDTGMESAYFEDTVQRMYTDDGHGGGRLAGGAPIERLLSYPGYKDSPWKGPGGPLFAAVVADRRDLVNEWNRLMTGMRAQADAPMWTWTDTPGNRLVDEATARPLYTTRYFPIPLLIPALGKIAVASNTTAMMRDGTGAAIALELWRRSHGSYPTTLDEMAPEYLPDVPVDRFDGAPLKYRLKDGRATIYSVGRDGDDDGGSPPPDNSGNAKAKLWAAPHRVRREMSQTDEWLVLNGDWIIWPPVKYDAEGELIPRP